MAERIVAVTLRGDAAAVNEVADYIICEIRYRLDNDNELPPFVTYWIDGEEPLPTESTYRGHTITSKPNSEGNERWYVGPYGFESEAEARQYLDLAVPEVR